MSGVIFAAPPSKSITQRALVLAALSERPSRIHRPLDCDDSRYLTGLLSALGLEIRWHADAVDVTPAPMSAPDEPVFCGNAGTAVRFGACLSLRCDGRLCLDGDAHMRRRPLGALVTALGELGVRADYGGRPGCPPVCLERGAIGSVAHLDVSLSSQYASGLLMVGPRLPAGLTLRLEGRAVSRPYLDMTLAMMREAGAPVTRTPTEITVAPGRYEGGDFHVEPDWSGAAFLLAAGFVTGCEVEIPRLVDSGLQGDAAIAGMLEELARPGGSVHFDLTDAPDLIAPLTAACLFASRPAKIRGAAHTRIKESDRVAVLAEELTKIGARITPLEDGLDVEPLAEHRAGAHLDPHDDHRMAMAFGLVGLRVPLSIRNRACVSKSFPDFFETLERLRTGAGHAEPPLPGGP